MVTVFAHVGLRSLARLSRMCQLHDLHLTLQQVQPASVSMIPTCRSRHISGIAVPFEYCAQTARGPLRSCVALFLFQNVAKNSEGDPAEGHGGSWNKPGRKWILLSSLHKHPAHQLVTPNS
eukprot:3285412-Amphidinium_carterae.1